MMLWLECIHALGVILSITSAGTEDRRRPLVSWVVHEAFSELGCS